MAEEEIDVIRHLLEIEKEASGVLLEAQKKADEIISDARNQADSRFHQQYSKVVEEIDAQEKAAKEKITASRLADIQAYKDSLSSTAKDQNSFNSVMDSLLFA